MIVPDDKDWTWVLDRSCPECGFDASTCAATEVPDLLRANATAWQELLREGAVRPGRPSGSTWPSLEYACHVRDVYARYAQRIELMLTEDDPLFPNWDQDVSAIEEPGRCRRRPGDRRRGAGPTARRPLGHCVDPSRQAQ